MDSRNLPVNGVIKYLEQVNQGSIKQDSTYTEILSNHMSAYKPNNNLLFKEDYDEKKK
jgi:hypothetical protein